MFLRVALTLLLVAGCGGGGGGGGPRGPAGDDAAVSPPPDLQHAEPPDASDGGAALGPDFGGPEVPSSDLAEATCAPPLSRCGDTCVNLRSDPANCGACGAATPLVAGKRLPCTDGYFQCPYGTTACQAPNRCSTFSTSAEDCGACGHSCVGGDQCHDGTCGVLAMTDSAHWSCNEACAAIGRSCAAVVDGTCSSVSITFDLVCVCS